MSVAFFVEAAQAPSAQVDGLAGRAFGSCCVGMVLLAFAGLMLGSGGTPHYEPRSRQHLGRQVNVSYDENRPVSELAELTSNQAAQRATSKTNPSGGELTVEHASYRKGGSNLQSIHDAMSHHYGGTGQGYRVNLTDAGGQDAGTFLVAPNTVKIQEKNHKKDEHDSENEASFWEEAMTEEEEESEDKGFRIDLGDGE